MRVRLDNTDQKLPPLRAGMSVEVDVDTGREAGNLGRQLVDLRYSCPW
jgi:multidrug resistance efflux pump